MRYHTWSSRGFAPGPAACPLRGGSGHHLAHRLQTHIHPRTGETVIDAPQIRVTAKGLAALHKALGGSDPSVLADPPVLPDMEVVS